MSWLVFGPSCSARARRRRRLVLVPASAGLLIASCSGGISDGVGSTPLDALDTRPGTTEPWSEFCGDAVGFVDHLSQNGVMLFDPSTAPDFMTEAQRRLTDMEASAPNEILPEVEAVHAAYRELEGLLVAVSYDVANIDAQQLVAEMQTDASITLDAYLATACGYGIESEGIAPQVLSDAELSELLDGGRATAENGEIDQLLMSLLTDGSGLDRAEADCVIAGLAAATKDELLGLGLGDRIAGGRVPSEAVEEFTRSLEACGLDPALVVSPLDDFP